MRPCLLSLAIFAVGSLAWPTSSRATTLRVPSEYATINAALDAAVAGDSVLVAPGIYDQYETRLLGDGLWFSSVAFLRGGVSLLSEAGAAATTLRMDATTAAPVILRAFGESGTTDVSGFTITGTVAQLSGVQFGFGGLLRIHDCAFKDLGVDLSDGLAIGSVRADLEIYGCAFENLNGPSPSAINQTSGTLLLEDSDFVNCRSGAIALRYDAALPHATGATIRRCRFSENEKVNGVGGAIFVSRYTTATIEDCWFESNRSIGSPSKAGAINAGGPTSTVVIRRNTFVGNHADYAGALNTSVPGTEVIENTFWGNWAGLNSAEGGSAVFFENAGILQGNVVAGSTGDEAVGRFNATVQTGCNIFWANSPGNATFPLDATDLVADPGFCDVGSNNFHVNAASPCVPGNGHPSCTDLIGAWGAACGVVSVEPWTWGHLKSAYRDAGRTP